MPRILSTHGNVIAADFRPADAPTVEIESEILYCDRLVCLSGGGCGSRATVV